MELTNWRSQLRILWLGQAVLMAVLAMSLPYWPLYIAKLAEFTPQALRYWSGAIYVAPFLTAALSAPLWGRLGDKYGYKPMIIRACLGLFITQTLILFCHIVWLIFIIRLLQGLLAGFIAAAQAWALAISPSEQSSRTIGKLQAATAIGTLFGPLVGAATVMLWGYHAVFTLASIVCGAITIVFLLTLQKTPIATAQATAHFSLLKPRDWRRASEFMTALLVIMVLVQFARTVITPVFSLFVTEQLGGNEMTVGILYAATGLMVFISAPLWGKKIDSMVRVSDSVYFLLIVLLFACAALQVLQAYVHTAQAVFVLRLLWGIALGAILPLLLRLLVDHAEVADRGVCLGLSSSATRIGDLLGISLGTVIETHFGYTNSFVAIALLYSLAGFIILFRVKSMHQAVEQAAS